ncbi:MAG: hypothetical protein DRO40_08830 [Thermoprotei archaeon]|nr:MAG: hypothetical protein DRO40_08830 [Thermoprotei archaeon]
MLFAFYSLRDKHHLDSLALIVHLVEGKWGRGFITNHILDEVLNILKYRVSDMAAYSFIRTFIDGGIVKIIYADEEVEKKALKIFKENIRKEGFSYTDAVTVAIIKELDIEYLLSYNLRSFSNLVDNIIGMDYWKNLPLEERKRIQKIISKYLV